MKKNQISQKPSEKVSVTEKGEMAIIVKRIIYLFKVKHT